jgi:hypothetical protein
MSDDYYKRQQKRGEDGICLLLRYAWLAAVFAVSFYWGMAFCR